MTQRTGTAVHVHLVARHAHLVHEGHRHHGKGLVHPPTGRRSATDQPSRSSSFRAAGTGAVGNRFGSLRVGAWPSTRARNLQAPAPRRLTRAPAPSGGARPRAVGEVDEELAARDRAVLAEGPVSASGSSSGAARCPAVRVDRHNRLALAPLHRHRRHLGVEGTARDGRQRVFQRTERIRRPARPA